MQYNEMNGIIIVKPHGSYIIDGSKKIIVKSKLFNSAINRPLLLIQQKEALGIIYLNRVSEITLQEFNRKGNLHLITDQERRKWWPNKRVFYEYNISRVSKFAAPVPIDYSTGPQVFVKISSIKLLQRMYIGTSGYSYSWWKDFYQHKSKTEDQFAIYSDNFDSLEINGSFYRKYKDETWLKLKDISPLGFAFSVKVNRSITHYYQFDKFNAFWDGAKLLMPKLKCLLFQFPEHFKYSENNMERLRSLTTDTNVRSVFEFRDISWFNQDVYDLFNYRKHWSIVISYHGFKWSDRSNLELGFNPRLDEWPITSDFVYIRLHGTDGKYTGSHKRILPKLVKFIRGLYKEGIKYAFVYFNNTDSLTNGGTSNAIVDAKYMQNISGF
jgi:uncharacterized protein YecE (DUF72 family)